MRAYNRHNGSFLIVLLITMLFSACNSKISHQTDTGVLPKIFPDYQFVTIPNNISPLNFKVEGSCDKVLIEFKYKQNTLEIGGKGKIDIPMKKWKKMLEMSKGDSISVTVNEMINGNWKKYKSFSLYVSNYQIDSYMAYRLIAPGYENWSKMGIYQRNLTDFKQTAIIENTLIPGSCVNCHSFKMNDASHMMFHLRSPKGGTFIIQDDDVKRLNTKTEKAISNCIYPYWHPSGDYIAFSVNKISQAFHSVKEKRIEVIDSESDVVILDIRNNKIITSDLISTSSNFETFPAFSPNGKYLYFTSASAKKIPSEYNQIRYNINRISFNPETGNFGNKVEEIFNADTIGKTVSFPRISPNDKYLMFTMADYGNFTIWHKEADLYLMDLNTLEYHPLIDANSEDTESYHSWSSDSRWFVFSSRRIDGLYTRPYIAFIGEDGKTGKPFLLPQKDPDYYTFLMQSFNIPELITGPVKVNKLEIEKMILKENPIQVK